MSEETNHFVETLKQKHGEVEIVSKGSSLKLCMVAEGSANIYQDMHQLWSGILQLVKLLQNCLVQK